MEIIRGFIEGMDDKGRYTVSMLGKREDKFSWIENVKPIYQSANITSGRKVGKSCIVLKMPLDNFLLGVYTPNEDITSKVINAGTGQELFWAGKDRVLALESNGDIGIYRVSRKDNGDLEMPADPILGYDRENDRVVVSSENIMMNMLGAGTRGNLIFEQDDVTGNFAYLFEGKLSLSDLSPRFRVRFSNPILPSTIKGSPLSKDGIFELTVDNLMSPTRVVPTDFTALDSISIKMGAQNNTLSGVSLSVGEFCDVMMGPMVSDPTHMVSIKTKFGSKIGMKTDGSIELSTLEHKSSVKLNPNGKISIINNGISLIEIAPNGQVNIVTAKGIELKASAIDIKGSKINIHTIDGTPGFNLIPICPFTGAKHVTSKVNSIA